MDCSNIAEDIIMSEGDRISKDKPCLWWLKVISAVGVTLSIRCNNNEVLLHLEPGNEGVFAVRPADIAILQGMVSFRVMDLMGLCKFQAFIDVAGMRDTSNEVNASFCYLHEPRPAVLTQRTANDWLMKNVLRNEKSTTYFCEFLRSFEAYKLVRFLLENMDENKTLRELGATYGLSIAHFRRLTKVALGNTVKSEISDWKMIRAMLDLLTNDGNITDVAIKHGYASLSHFSSVVKSAFDYPPKVLLDKIKSGLSDD